MRSCVNPYHLFLGTPTDNCHDMIRKGRDRQQRGADRYNAVLTPEIVRSIRQDYAAGLGSQAELAAKYGICRGQYVRDIIIKRVWRHVQ
jgi:hypothetical protein